MRFSPLLLLIFVFFLASLMAVVQLGLVTFTFQKLGLSAESAFLLLFSSLFGSLINLPLFSMRAEAPPSPMEPILRGLLRATRMPFTGRTVIAVNVGGGVIPVFFSLYLMGYAALDVWQVALGIAAVTAISYLMSRPLAGVGIGMPIFVAPITAAIVAIVIGGDQSAPLAYIAGTLGVLVGADLLRFRDVSKLGVPFASIGGAGTFDGIFITGLIAVLLA